MIHFVIFSLLSVIACNWIYGQEMSPAAFWIPLAYLKQKTLPGDVIDSSLNNFMIF